MNAPSSAGATLRGIYDTLYEAFGPQHWWPGETPDEIIIGAILTQNTAWTNVERAIVRLKSADVLSLRAIHEMEADKLADLIRPAGTFRVKAKRLKAFVDWLHDSHGGDLKTMFACSSGRLRESLLSVSGIGPETADAILLYAGNVTTFVVDAYTKRVLRRHFVIDANASYEQTKALFEKHVQRDAAMFGEYHALLVMLGKRFCRPKARCESCPLSDWNHDADL